MTHLAETLTSSHEPQGLADDELTPLVAGQTEDEADAVEGDEGAGTFKASIAAKDWTVETLVNQMRKGRIDLSPTFQRRNAWLGNRKSRLIESILIGYPIPQIVLAENRDRPGTYFVLDGKQRLLALRQFFVDPTDPRDEGFEQLQLEQLEVLSELSKLSIGDLEARHADLFATLENYTIRTVVLSGWNSERLLLSLFLRLNTGSLTLSPQELRQALIPGRFLQWIDSTSGGLQPLLQLLGNQHPDRRMVDAELLLRYLAFSKSPLQYRGNLKQFLDDTSRDMNRDWTNSEPILTDAAQQLNEALIACFIYSGIAAPAGSGPETTTSARSTARYSTFRATASVSPKCEPLLCNSRRTYRRPSGSCVTNRRHSTLPSRLPRKRRRRSERDIASGAMRSRVWSQWTIRCPHRSRKVGEVPSGEALKRELATLEVRLLREVSSEFPAVPTLEEAILINAYVVLAHGCIESTSRPCSRNTQMTYRSSLAAQPFLAPSPWRRSPGKTVRSRRAFETGRWMTS
jgi:hypothetical protein